MAARWRWATARQRAWPSAASGWIRSWRAAMLVRANRLAIGHSDVRPQTLQTLIAMSNASVQPVVPEIGSLGASGDLAPLSHLVLVLSRGDDESNWEDV